MYSESLGGKITIAMFVITWVLCLITFVYGTIYLYRMTKCYRPEKRWGRFIPFSIFYPSFFNDTGNYYRVKFIRNSVLFVILMAVMFGTGMINEMLSP